MNFNLHSNLAGAHAFLSPSDYHWVNYDEDKLLRVWHTKMAARRGSELHELAQRMIRLEVKLADTEQTLNRYVNDAIGLFMTPEQTFFYSPNCYGHADCASFRNKKLRIHDLKTGLNEASFMQLLIYAALFCLEYRQKPNMIEIELRIYQNDEVRVLVPEPHEVFVIMDKIVSFDSRINDLRMGVHFDHSER
jgi:hypothetical protein